jgi:hypothetical protein
MKLMIILTAMAVIGLAAVVMTAMSVWTGQRLRAGLRRHGVRLVSRPSRRLAWGAGVAVPAAVLLLFCINVHVGLAALGMLACLGSVMTLSIYTDLPTYSFQENVADALVGKEGYPVELLPGTLKIQLLNAGIYIGDLFERLEGSQAFGVNLRGPIKKALAGGALNAPAYVKMTANGLVAAGSGDKAHGIVIFPFVCAQGDQVSYIKFDCVMP